MTNIDREHMDCYRDMADVEHAFVEFMDRVPFYGLTVVCNDDDRLRALLPQLRRRVMTYGSRPDSDFRVSDSETPHVDGHDRPTSRFRVEYRGQPLGEFHLHVPGRHNVLNATAAIAVGVGLEVAPDAIRRGLAEFRGVDRRFQMRGRVGEISVIDDYGHHPTEIRATLAAARQCGYKRIHVVFQPHRYTRTQDLADQFATAFGDADSLFVLDIYAASEPPIEGVTGERLARHIASLGKRPATHAASFGQAIEMVTAAARPGDMILTMGAGSVSQLGPQILERLESRQSQAISATESR